MDMARNWKWSRAEASLTIRIRHILCPIDFSDASRHALDHAVALARWYDARLSVLHVHQLSMPVYGVSYVGPEGLQPIVLTDLERQQLLERLDTYVAADRAATDLEIETVLDETVNVPDAILACARSTPIDLIALGTHGRSGFQRLVLGSIAEKVLRKACCTVLTVPPHAPDVVPRNIVSIQRILCPVDFSCSSRRALEYAGSLAQEAHARLTVLHVLELPPALSEFPYGGLAAYRNSQFQKARKHLSEAVRASVPPACPVDELLLVGGVHREILRVAADQGADLIAMGIQGRGSVDRMFFGSTANHVVREATCPVLTLRGERER
jgi:nucleotide-binding universal stress UspA family protein